MRTGAIFISILIKRFDFADPNITFILYPNIKVFNNNELYARVKVFCKY